MDAVLLARLQFALTIGFHYLFPPLTIGMSWIICWMMWKHLKTGDELYGRMSRFWLWIFAVSFAIGVATGVTMEFQFGTNWSDYSKYVGDIFGAPLAAEGLLAFFLESTFIGVLLYGGKKFSPKALWFSSLMVAVGATLSAFWIIVANSWQQTPAGYHLVGGRAEMTDFMAAVFNPSTIPRYFHVVDSALITGALYMMGLSAWFLLKGKHLDFARESFKLALMVGFVAAVLQLPLGHVHAVQVAETQPAKLAAFEGLFETERGADMLLFGIPNAREGRTDLAVGVPGLLSFLVGFSSDTEVQGLLDFPRDEWPPLGLTFTSFHLMVLMGFYFIAFTGLGVFLRWRGSLTETRWYLKLAFWTIPIPLLANELGWIAAEVGRQPWIVYGLLKTRDAVSPTVPAYQIVLSILIFSVIYALLFGVWVYLIRMKLNQGPETAEVTS